MIDWRSAEDHPPHNAPVWMYTPAIGNCDEGFGYVEPGCCLFDGLAARRWIDGCGREASPALWAWMEKPEPPFVGDTKAEAERLCREYLATKQGGDGL